MGKTNNDVFVSFSFADLDLVKKIVETLEEKYGITAWMCTEELHAGDKYFSIIPPFIKSSKVFVLFSSKYSLSSKEVGSEIKIAWNANKTIIPFLVDSTAFDNTEIEYFLVNYNYIDSTGKTLEEAIDDLSQSIYATLSKVGETSHLRIIFRERLLSSKMVFPITTFVGREETINQIDEKNECF